LPASIRKVSAKKKNFFTSFVKDDSRFTAIRRPRVALENPVTVLGIRFYNVYWECGDRNIISARLFTLEFIRSHDDPVITDLSGQTVLETHSVWITRRDGCFTRSLLLAQDNVIPVCKKSIRGGQHAIRPRPTSIGCSLLSRCYAQIKQVPWMAYKASSRNDEVRKPQIKSIVRLKTVNDSIAILVTIMHPTAKYT
jgi:hypothetical protein